jgi:hypothetical protein
VGRTVRLVGLLVDRDFGLVAWAPVWLLCVAALAALVRRRPDGWELLALPLGAGWATATWVALTMHGWWWPGRQVVVVLPCAVLALSWWAGQVRWVRVGAAVAGAVGALTWAWLVVEVLRGERTLIVDFAGTSSPWFRALHPLLPDGRDVAGTRPLFAVWIGLIAAVAVVGWRSARCPAGASAAGDEDAGAGEGAHADVVAVDLDGDGAVR